MLAVLVCAALVNRYGSNAHKSAALAPALLASVLQAASPPKPALCASVLHAASSDYPRDVQACLTQFNLHARTRFRELTAIAAR